MILRRPVHIARKGSVIGEFSSSRLPELLERGEILPDDTCYMEESNEWQSVEDYIRATAPPKAKAAVQETFMDAPQASKPITLPASALGLLLGSGLVFALVLLAVVGAWIFSLQGQLKDANERVDKLQKELRDRPGAGEPKRESPAMPTERTKVSGRVFLRDGEGRSKPLPGFYVDLFEEKKIRAYLESRSLDLAAFKQSRDPDIMNRILNGMPPPVLKTTTDSAGDYEFRLPAEGRFVAYSSMSVDGPEGPDIILWFLSFGTDDPLNVPVNLTDENRSTRFEPEFLIKLGRPDTTSAN